MYEHALSIERPSRAWKQVIMQEKAQPCASLWRKTLHPKRVRFLTTLPSLTMCVAIDCLASTFGVATRGMTTKGHARRHARSSSFTVWRSVLRDSSRVICRGRATSRLTWAKLVVSAVPRGRTALLQNVRWSDLLATRRGRLSARRLQVVFQRRPLSHR